MDHNNYLNTCSSMTKTDYSHYLENYTFPNNDTFSTHTQMIVCLFFANTAKVIARIVICTGFPLTSLAIYSLRSLVENDHVAPVYQINLLISDLIQICCLVFWVAVPSNDIVIIISSCVYYICVQSSVEVMVCVAVERYLVVAWPLWYHFKRSIKSSVLVSVMVWVLCFTEICFVLAISHFIFIFHSIFLLLPFPVLIFCLAGILKSLSSAISVTPVEKRRIIGTLALVLLNYSLLFLPWVIWLLSDLDSFYLTCPQSQYLSFLQFSPLADVVLYVFMRKGAVDKLLASLCCCRMTGEEEQGQVATCNEKKHRRRRRQLCVDRAGEED